VEERDIKAFANFNSEYWILRKPQNRWKTMMRTRMAKSHGRNMLREWKAQKMIQRATPTKP